MLKRESVQSSVEVDYAEEELKAQEELRRSEEKFRRFFERANDCMAFLDVTGRILDVNEKAVEVFGGSREELLGKHFAKIGVLSLRDVPMTLSAFAKALAGEKTTVDVRIKNRKGREIHVEVSGSLMKIDGKLAGMFVIARDITERKRAEEELTRLSNAVKMSTDSIVISDQDGKIIDVNDATLKIYGTDDKRDLIGKNSFDLIALEDQEKAFAGMKETLEKGYVKSREYNIVTKDGGRIPVEMSVAIIRGADDKPTGFVGISRDITERKQVQMALRESEVRYRELAESISDVFFAMDRNLRYTFWNKASEELTGISAKDAMGKSLTEVFPDVKGTRVEQFYIEVLRRQQPQSFVNEYQVRGKDYVFEISAYPTKDGLSVFVKNITERKKTEEVIRESEEKYRSLFENARDTIATFDLKGNITSVNGVVEEYGFKKEELIGKNMLKLVSKRHWPKLLRELAKISQGYPNEGEIEIVTPKGKKISEYRSNPIRQGDRTVGFQAILRDITERRQTEEALKESEERLKQLIEYAPDAIYINDLKGNFMDGNKQAETLTGYKKEELIGKNMLKVGLLPKRYVPKAAEALMKNFLGRKTGPDEFELVKKDGSRVTVEISTFPVRRGGKVEVIGIARDITERKMMEEAIRESEEKFRGIFENVYDVVAYVDKHGKILDVNNRVEEVLGYERDEIIGKNFTKLGPIDLKSLPKILKLFLSTMRSGEAEKLIELKLKHKNGNDLFMEVGTRFIKKNGKVEGVVNVFRDITERKRMENELKRYSEHLTELVEERTKELKATQEQLIKSERMAAIGELATMVGHDLRNPLQSIENAAYYLNNELPLLASSLPNPRKTMEMLQVISDSLNHADKIIRDLQDFATTRKPALESTDINTLVKETLSQIRMPNKVELRTELSRLPEITVDKDQMKRVFLNLTTNAIQAMENGGTLTVSTKQAKGFVEVGFKDTGVGIPKESMEKIFTPFFTTRAKGMGMGLPICKKFVEAHGGTIQVESEVGKGTTFTVKLPIKQQSGGEKQ